VINVCGQLSYTIMQYFSFSAVTAIDTSGLETLGELRKMLEKRSLQVQTLIDILISEGLKNLPLFTF
jgi:anti-anti-sigma regulatory factor